MLFDYSLNFSRMLGAKIPYFGSTGVFRMRQEQTLLGAPSAQAFGASFITRTIPAFNRKAFPHHKVSRQGFEPCPCERPGSGCQRSRP